MVRIHSAADPLLMAWHGRMLADGDLDHMFLGRHRAPDAFQAFFTTPTTELHTEVDDDGIWLAAWLYRRTPGESKLFGLWVRNDRRRTLTALKGVRRMYEFILGREGMVVGLTKQEALIAPHRKFGYDTFGPFDVEGEPAWFVVLTKDGYESKRASVRV